MSIALLLAGLVILIGALVQGAVGFGMNLLAAPLVALVEPSLVPIPLLLASSIHAVLALLREHSDIDWRGVGWAIVGRIPGTVLGVLAVTLLPERGLGVVVGLSVLVCVALSVLSWQPQLTPSALIAAGTVSGAFGTSSSIGGPPIALLYQNSTGAAVRSTLGAYFVLGTLTSVAGLSLSGQLNEPALLHSLVLVPFLLAGFALSGPLRVILDRGATRPAILTVAAASAALLIVRSLI